MGRAEPREDNALILRDCAFGLKGRGPVEKGRKGFGVLPWGGGPQAEEVVRNIFAQPQGKGKTKPSLRSQRRSRNLASRDRDIKRQRQKQSLPHHKKKRKGSPQLSQRLKQQNGQEEKKGLPGEEENSSNLVFGKGPGG